MKLKVRKYINIDDDNELLAKANTNKINKFRKKYVKDNKKRK